MRTIDNCKVIKTALAEGIGEPLTEQYNDQVYCQGYQKSVSDDEPYFECLNCRFNIFYLEHPYLWEGGADDA